MSVFLCNAILLEMENQNEFYCLFGFVISLFTHSNIQWELNADDTDLAMFLSSLLM